MKRYLTALALVLALSGVGHASGLLIPVEKTLPPLAMLNHKVTVSIEDQVAMTKVEQTFRNHTSRPLEATYVFPVPKGAKVGEFAMWVNGKKMKGEVLSAEQAKKLFTDIVRQAQNPALLEYIGSDLLRIQVFPVPARGDQRIEVNFTSICRKDNEIVDYVYPLKTDGKTTSTLEEFSMKITLKSQQPIVNIYSPTHALTVSRANDRQAEVIFEKQQAVLDKDFQLFYTTGSKDVGVTSLMHRPLSADDGFFMLLISPRAELVKEQTVPRDMVFVIDTSGSMLQDDKMEQAKKALKHCLSGLSDKDRFTIVQFSTNVNRYADKLLPVNGEQIAAAKKWVDKLDATGGTNINDALVSALELQEADDARTFTVVFLTDGKPTIGVLEPEKILGGLAMKNKNNTRIFTLGVGNDVNAALLDQLAERTKAVSVYVRPQEDLEVKASSFFNKINKPVLANLKLTTGPNVRLVDIYPTNLPDLFHGDQLVVIGRYQGDGHAAITLKGQVGKETKEFVYELDFPPKTDEDRSFVEDLWARRKVGYLMEQIRLNGENKELVQEVTKLAKKYGITTPYTSWLIMPDAPVPVAAGKDAKKVPTQEVPVALAPGFGGRPQQNVADFAKQMQMGAGGIAGNRGGWQDQQFAGLPKGDPKTWDEKTRQQYEAKNTKDANDLAYRNFQSGAYTANNVGKQGVDCSVYFNGLKGQNQLTQTALKRVGNRNCIEVGGVWIDEGYTAKTNVVTVKAMSDAYFRILEKKPEMKEVFQLGNHLVWVAPNGNALVIDTNEGKDKLTDAEIDALFVAAR